MNKLAIVLAAATAVAACNNSTEQTTAVHSVDSAASAAPDTIKAVTLDSAARPDSSHPKL